MICADVGLCECGLTSLTVLSEDADTTRVMQSCGNVNMQGGFNGASQLMSLLERVVCCVELTGFSVMAEDNVVHPVCMMVEGLSESRGRETLCSNPRN
jgi:hypothetical protein